jgi:RimJ/RimL family protein N-acetyltransferase
MGVAAANERAARAYEKAGFHLFRAFQEDDQDMRYYVRSL